MFAWASDQFDKLSQTMAPPPTDPAGRFNYAVTRNDENTAMGCIAEMDPTQTIVQQSKGWFPIHMACQYSMVRLIRLIMNQPGIQIQQHDYAGCTPLHHACMSTQRATALEVVKLLINDYNADPCAKNSQGQTPYDLASLDSVRQYLLPIQLQKETQYALDNGGQGLPPGIDLGGLKISRPNMAPPPQFGGAGVVAAPQYSQTPGPTSSFASPQPIKSVAPAPASMPSKSSKTTNERYSRTGGSSLAMYSKYKADGFHSSSSDVALQKKYGHVGVSNNVNTPPPRSGNSVGPNPFSGATALSGVQRYASYGPAAAAAPSSVPVYAGMAHPAATAQPVPTFFTPGAPAPAPESSLPPPPYSGVESSPASPFATPQPKDSAEQDTGASNLFDSPPKITEETNQEATSDWVETIDPSTGNTYYFNSKTGETSWEPPEASTKAEDGSDEEWTETVDPTTGKTYYYNQKTGETSWEKPLGDSGSQEDQGWVEATDPSSGNVYFYNSVTGETSWEKPMALKTTTVTSTDAPLQDELAESANDSEPVVTEDDAAPIEARGEETILPSTDAALVEETTTSDEPPLSEDSVTTSPISKDLPDGWTEVTDPTSGKVYYCNTATQETSWERPVAEESTDGDPLDTQGSSHVEKEGTDSSPGDETKDPIAETKEPPEVSPLLPEGWTEVTDPSSGKAYYYNAMTQETSWEKPVNEEPTDAPVDSQSSSDAPADPTENEIQERDADDSKPETEETLDESPFLPEGWSEVTDPSSGNVYYFNANTQETSWEKPLAEESMDTPVDSQSSSDALTDPKENEIQERDADDSKPETEETLDESPSLPEGWSEVTDPSSGNVYYFNANTQETSWEKPLAEESMDTPLHTQSSLDAPADPRENGIHEPEVDDSKPEMEETSDGNPSLPEGWSEVSDPSSGQTYYYNAMTQETSWERPIATNSDGEDVNSSENAPGESFQQSNLSSEGAEGEENLAQGWEEVQDPSSGKSYYYNKETHETSWEKPTLKKSPPLSSTTDDVVVDLPAENNSEWTETLDPSSGRHYYYNAKTGETSWEKPDTDDAALVEEDSAEATSDVVETTPVDSNLEDTCSQAAADSCVVEQTDKTPLKEEHPSTLARGHVRHQSAEEMFASPPGDTSPATTSANATKTAEDLFGDSTANGSQTAQDLFGSPAATNVPEDPKANDEAPSNEDDNSKEMEDGELTEISLSPEPVSYLTNDTKPLPNIPNTTDIPAIAPEVSAAPVSASNNDLFASIGLPPPPFQSKR